MAKDEMQMITEDKWGQEVWGVARDSTTDTSEVVGRPSPSPKLIFYFGENVCSPKHVEQCSKRRAKSA